jgi:glycosyltransferase involved in cell wall biosynthesis
MRKLYLDKVGSKGNKIHIIHNGTEISLEYAPRKDRNTFVIGSAGRLFPVKDYPLLVEIAREVLQENGNIRFELAGEGPEEGKILSMVHEYGIEKNFILKGFIEDMKIFYQGLDIYINTSIHEGLPMSILEAMASGLPVIAPSNGGIKEVVTNGVEGYLVNVRNSKIFSEMCIKLIRDNQIKHAMGKASRERIIKEYSLDKMADNYYDLYSQVMMRN